MIRPPACMEGVGGGDQTVEWPEPCPRVEQGTKTNTASQCLVLRTQHLVATYCSPGTHSCFTEPGGEVVPLFSIHLRSKRVSVVAVWVFIQVPTLPPGPGPLNFQFRIYIEFQGHPSSR